MKILFTSHAKISEQEGDSTHILEMALNLQKQGNDLLLICQDGKQVFYSLKIVRLPGLRIKYLTSLFLDLISISLLIFQQKDFQYQLLVIYPIAIHLIAYLFIKMLLGLSWSSKQALVGRIVSQRRTRYKKQRDGEAIIRSTKVGR